MRRRFEPRFIHVLFLVFVAFACYGPSLDNYWIKDDLGIGAFTDGARLEWRQLLPFLWPSHMESEQYWRPLPIALGFVDYAFWGTNPIGYHVVNTLLHTLVGIVVYFLANRLTDFTNPTLGFVTALAVTVNPIAPEAVVWVLQRMVLMCAVFYLGAMLAWLKAIETGRTRWRLVGYVALVGGLLSKEVAATLPGVLALMDLLYASPDRGFRRRLGTAIRWAIPAAVILTAYLGCRYAMWGRVDLKYAGLEPLEYARHNLVFERMGASLTNSLLPVNAGMFGERARDLLRAAMLAAYGLAALRGLWLLVVDVRFRRIVALSTVFVTLSFAPTTLIFWIDERLFNARFFYQPAIAVLLVTGAALWLSPRDGRRSGEPPSWSSRAVPYLGSLLLVGAFAISLGGGLRAFDQGADQVRHIQQAIARYAQEVRADGIEPVIVALDTPSQVSGVPTFETNLRLALLPPLLTPGIDCIPLLDVFRNTAAWPDTLARVVVDRGIDPSRLRYVRCVAEPPDIQPLLGAPEPAYGPYPATLVAPVDGAFFRNDDAAPDFVFRPVDEAVRYVLCVSARDGSELRINVVAGRNAAQEPGGTLRYRFADGDAATGTTVDPWEDVIRKPQPFAVPLSWRVESFDATGRLVGVAADHRMLVFSVTPAR